MVDVGIILQMLKKIYHGNNWNKLGLMLDRGVRVTAGRKHFSMVVICAFLGVVSCYSPAIGIQWQLETDDGLALFQRLSFAYCLSITMLNWYWFFTAWSFSLCIPLPHGGAKESRRKHWVSSSHSSHFYVYVDSELIQESWIQSSDRLIRRVGSIRSIGKGSEAGMCWHIQGMVKKSVWQEQERESTVGSEVTGYWEYKLCRTL